MIEQLVSRGFQLRNSAHLAHWAAKGEGSFARHMALGSLYEAIPGQLDAIVEAYQGCKGLIKVNGDSANFLPYLKAEEEWLAKHREEIANGVPSVLNMLDDLHGMYASAAYKLKYLK